MPQPVHVNSVRSSSSAASTISSSSVMPESFAPREPVSASWRVRFCSWLIRSAAAEERLAAARLDELEPQVGEREVSRIAVAVELDQPYAVHVGAGGGEHA